MGLATIIGTAAGYLLLLFLVAYLAEQKPALKSRLVNSPVIYALSLAVYCTAWTFYGSVGRAATQGISFLPIYLGPTIAAPLWILLLRKIILISKAQRLTSIADFISSRHGKSTALGVLATFIAVLGVIPYIAIQLKAIKNTFEILAAPRHSGANAGYAPFYQDSALYIAIVLGVFTILFGTRKLDPTERHEGLVATIAFESVVKLVAFLAVGLFVTFGLFGGFGDLFRQSLAYPEINRLFSLDKVGIDGWQWFWLILLSMSAILFLPRQFHLAVVENTNPDFLRKASWLFPLYLLLINIFVIPIAIGGLIHFPEGSILPDTFVLNLPLRFDQELLALFVAIGGFSAATSMVIVAVIALSIMINNNLVLPFLLRPHWLRGSGGAELPSRLMGIRRLSIIIVLLIAYGFLRSIGERYSLVSIGLISFTAILQFAPAALLGMYWKGGAKAGAMTGLSAGFLIWFFTLPFPALLGGAGGGVLEEGLLGMGLLRPNALFGLEGFDPISHAAFWSLFFNLGSYFFVSLYSRQSALEVAQADLFVDIHKYRGGGSEYEVMRRRAPLEDIRLLLNRFLGAVRANKLLDDYAARHGLDLDGEPTAGSELITYAETHLAGAIGAASAKVIVGSIVKEDPISLEEMLAILDQTQEMIQYSRALEKKSQELEQTTRQLQQANAQLQKLDQLKADFITTVTHELRTPITSIKALSRILLDEAELEEPQRQEFLGIIVSECERITRLINQVLDLEKIQSPFENSVHCQLNLREVVRQACRAVTPTFEQKQIQYRFDLPDCPVWLNGHYDRLIQVVVNLLSNAAKFADPQHGNIHLSLETRQACAFIRVEDNGRGVSPEQQETIFEKFTQVHDPEQGKPQGSGLGLFISKMIVEQHGGRIGLESRPGEGAVFTVELPIEAES